MQQQLEELSVQQLVEKHNFVIPEIQREYVWGSNEHSILDKFFHDIKEGIREKVTGAKDLSKIAVLEQMLEQAEAEDREAIAKMLEKYKKDMNIGFVYSYKPDYYLPGDRGEDAFLIDGQQRFTTLFLALFYFSLKEQNKLDFVQLFRFNPKLDRVAFDYRVRSISHSFLMHLIANCNAIEDIVSVRNKTWFLSSFATDVTVKGMLSTISRLHEQFNSDEQNYYQFIKKQIKFWHFKTEETTQGEELYITMNSRGQQLAENETIRAKLFEADEIKHNQIAWGAKWEEWQDFFWRHREKGGNADFGFNQFLRWVNVIECLANETHRTREAAEKRYKTLISENTVLDYVTLDDIEPYFNSLAILMDLYDQQFFSSTHFKGNFDPVWTTKAPAQSALIALLPGMMFLTKEQSPVKLNRYVRYFSNAARDSDFTKSPDTFIVESIQLTKAFLDAGRTDVVSLLEFSEDFPRLIPSEEVWKISQLKDAINGEHRENIEHVIWSAEDFEVNKGKIGHLIQASLYSGNISEFTFIRNLKYTTLKSIDAARLESVSQSYKEVFGNAGLVWGDLLPTNIYVQLLDRLVEGREWQFHDSFIRFVLHRNSKQAISLSDFCLQVEKEFLKSYADEDALRAEQNPAKQLYIYYILLNKRMGKWKWNNRWNVGIYPGGEYPNANSIFSTRFVYQFYNTQWRYNVGYEPGSGIWLQDHYDPNRNYLGELMTWARGVRVPPVAMVELESDTDELDE
jgi:hypothetical protein